MKIVKVNNDIKIEVGDVLESKDSGRMYLITNFKNEYTYVELTTSESSRHRYKKIEDIVTSIFGTAYTLRYITHKSENIKLNLIKKA